jgi:DNA-binding HxlR family transcriptional regulator
VLTENLRDLEDAGLVVRRDLGGSVRHVEYDFSEAMRPKIQAMLDHLADFGETVGGPPPKLGDGVPK